MKTLTLLLLTLLSCKTSTSQKNEVAIMQVETQNQAGETALNFINSYVVFCNSGNQDKSLTEWVSEQPTVTRTFKTALEKVLSEAEKKDPEYGLGFDPIFNAQDYPDKGFKLVKTESQFVTVKAIDWPDWELKIKMELKDKRWFVDGIGVINMTKTDAIHE